ncbi:MAG: hypothetical protein DCF12_21035 [Snowella sp.]|jgi:hypothetical protein|nr:MAG: hypothetical protein DCF12_21035 [Snowella sp.]
MQVTTSASDLLPHIALNQGTSSPINLSTAAIAANTVLEGTSGSHTFFGIVEVDYSLSISPPEVKVDIFITHFGQKTRIGGIDLNPNNPNAKIGGSVLGVKAEVDLSFDFNTYILTITATGCLPIVGCKTASTQIHL